MILLAFVTQTSSHALPGTYHYITIQRQDISYRLIISGIDMCRVTGWHCQDLTKKDLPRLKNATKELQKKFNRGIRIFQGNHRLYLTLKKISPLPFGFALTLQSHGTNPIRDLTIQYSLLEKKNPAFQSFFSLTTQDNSNPPHLLILNAQKPVLKWKLGNPPTAHPVDTIKQHLFDLQSFIRRDLSVSWLFIGFLMAFLLGIGHAFTPGHGKSLMAAYLVGQHGHIKDAVIMGLTTTFTHTFSVVLLGLIIMFFSHLILPSTLFPWVARISALLIIATGIYVLYTRIRDKRSPAHASHSHDHAHPHGHSHHSHSHDHDPHHSHGHSLHPPSPGQARSHTWQAFWLSFSGGIIPCPSAMAVLFAAIAFGKIGYGILMILVFSLGLGVTLVSIGIAILTSRNFLARMEKANALFRHLDLVGPVFIIIMGILFLIHGPFGSLKI